MYGAHPPPRTTPSRRAETEIEHLDTNIPINIGDGPPVPEDYKVFALLVLGLGHKSKRVIDGL